MINHDRMRDIIDLGVFSLEIIASIVLLLAVWIYMYPHPSNINEDKGLALTSDCSYTLRGTYTQFRGKPVCKMVPLNKD